MDPADGLEIIGEEILYVGIIDTLIPYGEALADAQTRHTHTHLAHFACRETELRKAGEHILKARSLRLSLIAGPDSAALQSAVYDGKSISIVPPNEYAPRFSTFMKSAIE